MMETTNSTFKPESTTSQLLVYDPYKAFFTRVQSGFFTRDVPEIFLGRNILVGDRKKDSYNLKFNDIFEYLLVEEGGYTFVKNIELNIEYEIENFSEIIPSLIDELIFLWNTYAIVQDYDLNEDAKLLKQSILKLYSVSCG